MYGDLQFLDILIFAGIAGFLIFRLRNVLGKRAGFEKKNSPKKDDEIKDNTTKEEKKPQLKENEAKLAIAYQAIQDFDHKAFLEGAKFAFEAIINAFNQEDTKTLKNLLTKEVYLSFEKAIKEGHHKPGFQFYSLVISSVENVLAEGGFVYITLKITSEQFKEEDENTVIKKQDLWTFQKNIENKSPIWLLSST